MIDFLRKFFFSEFDKDASFLRLVRTVLAITAVATAAIAIVIVVRSTDVGRWVTVAVILSVTILSAVLFYLTYRNILWPAKALYPLVLLVAVTYITIRLDGLHSAGTFAFMIVIIIASLFIGQKVIPLATFLSVVGVWIVGLSDLMGYNQSYYAKNTRLDEIVTISIIQIAAGAILYGLMARLNAALEISRTNEQAQLKANQELRGLQAVLENRVSERTHSLELASEVGRAVSEVRTLDVMLKDAAEIIRSRFNLYYTQVYI